MNLNNVLLIALQISFATAASDYTRLGCYKDSWLRTMSKQLSNNVKSVEECANLARKAGYSTFGVQAGKECYSKDTAAQQYKSQGVSTGCNNGMGGSWANDVYQFNAETYKDLGCWKDSAYARALSKYIGKYNKDVSIRTCADMTRSKGFSVFGVQDGGWCFSGENAESTYNKHGNSSKCKVDGTGAAYVNNVYQLPAQKCFSCNGKDSCSKITCSSDAYCYKLSADQELAGTVSRVTLGGCMSNCTEQGQEDGCAGKKNCHLTCCSYENCNDPNTQDNFPKCHACKSDISAADCTTNQYQIPCSKKEGDKANCYTAATNGTYIKGCSDNYLQCLIVAGNLCKGKDASTCNMKCCSGELCNTGTQAGVSGFLVMACALIMLMF